MTTDEPEASTTEAARWLSKAADDLAVARLLLTAADAPRWPALARHGRRLTIDRAVLIDLQPWAVAGRYPEDVPDPSLTETSRLLSGAEQVVEAVRTALVTTDTRDDAS